MFALLGGVAQWRPNDQFIVGRTHQPSFVTLNEMPFFQLGNVGVDVFVIPRQRLRQSSNREPGMLGNMAKKLHSLRGKQGRQLRDRAKPDRGLRCLAR